MDFTQFKKDIDELIADFAKVKLNLIIVIIIIFVCEWSLKVFG